MLPSVKLLKVEGIGNILKCLAGYLHNIHLCWTSSREAMNTNFLNILVW